MRYSRRALQLAGLLAAKAARNLRRAGYTVTRQDDGTWTWGRPKR